MILVNSPSFGVGQFSGGKVGQVSNGIYIFRKCTETRIYLTDDRLIECYRKEFQARDKEGMYLKASDPPATVRSRLQNPFTHLPGTLWDHQTDSSRKLYANLTPLFCKYLMNDEPAKELRAYIEKKLRDIGWP